MDVRCERCSTDYEFDDALVSGRGTTVKCTNCGHKFKIRRKDGDFSEDFWNIQTSDGKTLVFTSLRELQRAIQSHLVEPPDLLSRGGLKQKPIGQIPELQPFFDQRDAAKSPPAAPVAPPATTSAEPPPFSPSVSAVPLAPARPRMSTRPDFLPPLSEAPPPVLPVSEVSVMAPLPEPPPEPEREREPVAESVPIPVIESGPVASSAANVVTVPEPPIPPALDKTQPLPIEPPLIEPPAPVFATAPPPTDPEKDPERFSREAEESSRDGRAALVGTAPLGPREVVIPKHSPPPVFEASSPLPPPAPAVVPREPLRDSLVHGPSMPAPSSVGRRRGVGGYVISMFLLAGVAILGIVYAKDHLGQPAKGATPVATADPRVAGFLEAGEKAVAEGNLELAKESFDKASALSEKDPHVLLDVARLAAARADVPWLKTRLLPEGATDDARLTKESLAELSAAARKAADDAVSASPDDANAIRAKVDALRIAGERDAARALVAKIGGTAPDTAYVLAALDLSEDEPLWSTVIERLRVAANAENGPGRGRAALVYALARSGDPTGAKAEVERLAAMARPHPLLPQLRAFAANAKPAPVATTDDKKTKKTDKTDKTAPPPDATTDKPDPTKKPTGDARQLVQQAETARAKGDLDKAQALFGAALDKSPRDTEALAGMAAIAHARHDLNGAKESYKRVLSINPSYVPALVGFADCEWESGEKAAAVKTYKDIIDRFPPGTYPPRVRQRAGADAPPDQNENGGGG